MSNKRAAKRRDKAKAAAKTKQKSKTAQAKKSAESAALAESRATNLPSASIAGNTMRNQTNGSAKTVLTQRAGRNK